MKKFDQRGTGIVEVLLILVIVGMVGFVGWYVWNSKKSADKTLQQAASQTSVGIIKKSSPTKDKTKYLEIKEWGVKVKLSEKDAGAYYKMRTDEFSDVDSAGVAKYADAYTSESDAIVGPTGVSCKGEYIAILMRMSAEDSDWQAAETKGLFTAPVQVGTYKYALATKKQYGPECFKSATSDDYVPSNETAAKFDDVVQAFKADFTSVEKL
jgi:hypothetical protein